MRLFLVQVTFSATSVQADRCRRRCRGGTPDLLDVLVIIAQPKLHHSLSSKLFALANGER